MEINWRFNRRLESIDSTQRKCSAESWLAVSDSSDLRSEEEVLRRTGGLV